MAALAGSLEKLMAGVYDMREGDIPPLDMWQELWDECRVVLADTPAQALERARAVEEVVKWARQVCKATNWVKAETTTAPGPGNELMSAFVKLDALGKEGA